MAAKRQRGEESMKSPIDIVRGRITNYDPRTQEVTIKAVYRDWPIMLKRGYKECNVQMIDSRPLSDKQRRTCYKLIREIANYTGMGIDPAKEYLKLKFLVEDIQETADKMFSLANAPMSLVCAFQRFLVDFILNWDIPCSFPLLDFVDDVGGYVYSCAVHKKCCICGKPAILHHYDRVGMGRDRQKIDHLGMKSEPLCWEHHTECHTMPQENFDAKYHLRPVVIDESIAKIYRLNRVKG